MPDLWNGTSKIRIVIFILCVCVEYEAKMDLFCLFVLTVCTGDAGVFWQTVWTGDAGVLWQTVLAVCTGDAGVLWQTVLAVHDMLVYCDRLCCVYRRCWCIVTDCADYTGDAGVLWQTVCTGDAGVLSQTMLCVQEILVYCDKLCTGDTGVLWQTVYRRYWCIVTDCADCTGDTGVLSQTVLTVQEILVYCHRLCWLYRRYLCIVTDCVQEILVYCHRLRLCWLYRRYWCNVTDCVQEILVYCLRLCWLCVQEVLVYYDRLCWLYTWCWCIVTDCAGCVYRRCWCIVTDCADCTGDAGVLWQTVLTVQEMLVYCDRLCWLCVQEMLVYPEISDKEEYDELNAMVEPLERFFSESGKDADKFWVLRLKEIPVFCFWSSLHCSTQSSPFSLCPVTHWLR